MIDKLPDLIHSFSGASSHTRCFNHIIALVAVQIVCQFDIPIGNNQDKDTEANKELQKLAEGLDSEDAETQREVDNDEEDDEEIEGWANERQKLSAVKHKEHDESTRPVQMLLVKVRSLLCYFPL
jgi:isopentenyl diphosphate isomerase/L-lactate dehydrogenase-like FMN-dependent dehydrogenase